MRRALLGALVAAVVIAGCGSSTTGAPSGALSSELSYFPAQAPLVVAIKTASPAHASQLTKSLEAKFPQLRFLRAVELAAVQRAGINYQRDIRPLLGNPILLGTSGGSPGSLASGLLIVWVTRSSSKLYGLLGKLHAQRHGTLDGANLYEYRGGEEIAVNGSTVVVARNRPALNDALSRHRQGQGMRTAQYAADLNGLRDSSVEMFGDLAGVLSEPGAAKARLIPWIAALRSYGVTFSGSSAGLTLRFRLNTDATQVSPSQLPIASGSGSPGLVSALPIQVGIRDPAQIFEFVESAMQATSAHGYATLLRQEAKLKRQTGVDLNDLISQLNGDLTIDSDTRTTLARVGVEDSGTVDRMLGKLASIPGALGKHATFKRIGSSLYSMVESHRDALLGLVGNQLVLAVPAKGDRATPGALRSFATAPSAPLADAGGSVSFRLEIDQLITLLAKRQPSGIEGQLLGLLGDLTGSMSATTSALTGTATLALK